MIVQELVELLENNNKSELLIKLPNGEMIPNHFHVTEIGRIQKDFIDCGGVKHNSTTCVLQTWFANDVDHRIHAGKLSKIIQLADMDLDNLVVEIEYGVDTASQYLLKEVQSTLQGLVFILDNKPTDCLAPDKCGITGCC